MNVIEKIRVSSAHAYDWAKAKTGTVVAVALAAASAVLTPVHAAAIDVADVVTDIAAQSAPVAAIGAAVLLLHVGIKAFRWVRKALS